MTFEEHVLAERVAPAEQLGSEERDAAVDDVEVAALLDRVARGEHLRDHLERQLHQEALLAPNHNSSNNHIQ